MCSDERFQEIRKRNGDTSQQVSIEIQEAIVEIDKDNRKEYEELKNSLF